MTTEKDCTHGVFCSSDELLYGHNNPTPEEMHNLKVQTNAWNEAREAEHNGTNYGSRIAPAALLLVGFVAVAFALRRMNATTANMDRLSKLGIFLAIVCYVIGVAGVLAVWIGLSGFLININSVVLFSIWLAFWIGLGTGLRFVLVKQPITPPPATP